MFWKLKCRWSRNSHNQYIKKIEGGVKNQDIEFEFLTFSSESGFYDQTVSEYGCSIYRLPSISTIGLYRYIKEMIHFFKSHQVDVVHSHMDWQGGFIAYAAHKAGIKKIVVHSHANQKMFDVNFIYRLNIFLNKILINKYSTDCLACSKEAGESLFFKDFVIIKNGIDTKKYIYPDINKIDDLRKEFMIKNDDIVLGHVGSFSNNKNQSFLIDILIELLKISSSYKLILVGDGGTKEYIKEKVISNGLENNVYFAGLREEIPEMMNLFDIFLFPSKEEGLGIVAIEAQASGTRCVISNSVPKMVDMNLGLVKFEELNTDKWTEDILKIGKNKINKSTDICAFDIENTVNQLVKVYRA